MQNKYRIDLWKRPHDTADSRWQADLTTESDKMTTVGKLPYQVLANLTAYWFFKDRDEDRLKDEDLSSSSWPAQSVSGP